VTPQQLADLWYLKFGYGWVTRSALDKDWKNISRELMKNNLAEYDLMNDPKYAITEIVKLKETCR
jgi:hypothetical protein